MPKVNLPILYSQLDSRWANLMLGYNTNLPYNFYNFACLITCLAMTARYYGKDWDPVRINEDFKKMGPGKAYVAGGGDYIPGGFNLLFGDIQEIRTVTPTALTNAQLGDIKTALDAGYPVMIGIDVNPKTVAYDSHFVLVVDYDPADENNLTIADPIGGRIRSLKDYLGWYKPSIRNTIESYVILKGKVPVAGPQMITVGKDQWELMRLNHDKWHQMVHYLDSTLDPNATPFEKAQSIIAGIKSRQTDLENQAKQVIGDNAVLTQQVKNLEDIISRLDIRLLELDKKRLADLDALKATFPDVTKLRGEYEGQLKALQIQIDEAILAKNNALIELAACKAETKDIKKTNTLIEKLMILLTKIFPS